MRCSSGSASRARRCARCASSPMAASAWSRSGSRSGFPQGAAARRARGRRALGRDRHHHRCDRAAAAGSVAPHHRARHGSGVPPGAAHHRSRPGRHSGRGTRRKRLPRTRGCARSISASARTHDAACRASYRKLARRLWRYRGARRADASICRPAARLAVLGRNGVGKTTLLATIMGHTTLHGGAIEFAGVSLGRLAPYLRARARASASCRKSARFSAR